MATLTIDCEVPAAEVLARGDNDPVTLHRTMQMMIGARDCARATSRRRNCRTSCSLFCSSLRKRNGATRRPNARGAVRAHRRRGALSGHAEIAEQARQVDEAGGQKTGSEQRVHRKNPEHRRTERNRSATRPQSMDETQSASPKLCFSLFFGRIHLSFTESGTILGGGASDARIFSDSSLPGLTRQSMLT
ncbi:MAG TPA: hypothetical protein VL048_17450 [Xanthobacteraceae bacterium]|nr:hypothetical protein [Xanthobacteraceae bacterium]